MAVAVAQPNQPRRKDFLDHLTQGVNVARNVFGIKADAESLKREQLKLETLQAKEEREKGINDELSLEVKSGDRFDKLLSNTTGSGIKEGEKISRRQAMNIASAFQKNQARPLNLRDLVDIQVKKRKLEQPNLTPGEEKRDSKFAAEISEFIDAGGFGGAKVQLDSLAESAKVLTKENVSGLISGGILQGIPLAHNLAPRSKEIMQDIHKQIQSSLRATLGAQFTEKEGEGIMRRTYDPSLPEHVNKKRVDRLVEELTAAAKAKQSAFNYWNSKDPKTGKPRGTLKGYTGPKSFKVGGSTVKLDQQFNKEKQEETFVVMPPNGGKAKRATKSQLKDALNAGGKLVE